jgi:S-adenosylmethionine:tRNA ribosyltransferase-isomerase
MTTLKPFANISPDQYSYELPEDRIAAFPVGIRDHSRLLIRGRNGSLQNDTFKNLSQYLPENSNLFFNNSKVIPARLIFNKKSGARIEVFCLKPIEPADYAQSLSATKTCSWECLVGNLKRFSDEPLQLEVLVKQSNLMLKAEKLDQFNDVVRIRFSWNNDLISFSEIIQQVGRTPLPPYIKRDSTDLDRDRYQTVYSRYEGSVAAPTAGLHFTDNVFKSLASKNITCHEVTLHVGAGTFQPIKSDKVIDHHMHNEYFKVTPELLKLLSAIPGRVACVGTTTIRTLESLYWLGVKIIQSEVTKPQDLHLEQWESYHLKADFTLKQSFETFGEWIDKQNFKEITASTSLMILPGYNFKVADMLVTNFHQPRSTLLLLIAAFIGESWKETYDYALKQGFRFLSYGDSSLLYCQ